jgi:hypothetical protein
MLYDDDFLDLLRDDPVPGTLKLCHRALDVSGDHDGWTTEDFDALVEAYALLTEVIDAKLLPLELKYPKFQGPFSTTACQGLFSFIQEVRDLCEAEQSKLRVDALRSRFRANLGKGFSYEFSQGDLDRVQALLNHLREEISACNQLEREHQQRLLRRLERLQSELHKRVSDLDRFWGLIGDAGVVLGKIGNDAKPIVDRIREIADIVWQTQSRAEELPSGTKLPQLEHKSDGASEA